MPSLRELDTEHFLRLTGEVSALRVLERCQQIRQLAVGSFPTVLLDEREDGLRWSRHGILARLGSLLRHPRTVSALETSARLAREHGIPADAIEGLLARRQASEQRDATPTG